MEEELTEFVWTNITSVIQITFQFKFKPFLFFTYAKTTIALGLLLFKRSTINDASLS